MSGVAGIIQERSHNLQQGRQLDCFLTSLPEGGIPEGYDQPTVGVSDKIAQLVRREMGWLIGSSALASCRHIGIFHRGHRSGGDRNQVDHGINPRSMPTSPQFEKPPTEVKIDVVKVAVRETCNYLPSARAKLSKRSCPANASARQQS